MKKTNETLPVSELTFPDFAPVDDEPGCWACRDGTIWSARKKGGQRPYAICLHGQPDRYGYPRIAFYVNRKPFFRYVSHLILETFVGPRPERFEACHFPDSDPLNNSIDNLRWDTREANMHDRKLQGAQPCGEAHSHAKMKTSEILDIRELSKFLNSVEIGAIYKVHPAYVRKIINRKIWTHI